MNFYPKCKLTELMQLYKRKKSTFYKKKIKFCQIVRIYESVVLLLLQIFGSQLPSATNKEKIGVDPPPVCMISLFYKCAMGKCTQVGPSTSHFNSAAIWIEDALLTQDSTCDPFLILCLLI